MICPDCGTEMKQLLVSFYCPNDCDKKEKSSLPEFKWYSWAFESQLEVGEVVKRKGQLLLVNDSVKVAQKLIKEYNSNARKVRILCGITCTTGNKPSDFEFRGGWYVICIDGDYELTRLE